MKKLLLLLPFAGILSFTHRSEGLTSEEREMAVKILMDSRAGLEKTIQGLSEEQLNFKPSPESWSVKECVYHLALSENNLWQWMEGVLKAPANPEKRNDIKMKDEQLVNMIEDRSHKVKTREPFEPRNAKWANVEEAMKYINEERTKHIDFIKTTGEDMRSHVTTEGPLGALDSYQLVLFMAGHMIRHTKQIEEVMANSGFPKK